MSQCLAPPRPASTRSSARAESRTPLTTGHGIMWRRSEKSAPKVSTGTVNQLYKHKSTIQKFEVKIFIQEGQIQLIGDYEEIWTFLLIKESWKNASRKVISSIAVFNIDNNNKCSLRRKSAYYNDFWRSIWLWRPSNDADNSALSLELIAF